MVLSKMLCGTVGSCGSDARTNGNNGGVNGTISTITTYVAEDFDSDNSSLEEVDADGTSLVSEQTQGRRPKKGRNGVKEDETYDSSIPAGGVELTLSELQDMASRQQQQIEAQQQMLVAKEQRLKFLRQQELRHQQAASENQRLRQLRERVEHQELKLKKLRELRGQVSDQRSGNTTLSGELDSIKALFTEKEKELVMAVQRVDVLSRQLEDLRKGNLNGLNGDINSINNNPAYAELEKLRKELMLRNKLNEQQNSKLAAQRDALHRRKDDMNKMDARIAELQARLRKKKFLQQQMPNQMQPNKQLPPNQGQGLKPGTQVATIEPFQKSATLPAGEDPSLINKQDPKYQTLPYSIKFSGLGNNTQKKEVDIYDIVASNRGQNGGKVDANKNTKFSVPTSQSVKQGNHARQDSRLSDSQDIGGSPRSSPAKLSSSSAPPPPPHKDAGSRLMSSFAPKPYGGSFASAVHVTKAGLNTTADTTSPSIIYTASGMPSSDPLLDSPYTSTPVVESMPRLSAREMFMLGKQQTSSATATTSSSAITTAASTTHTTVSTAVSNSSSKSSSSTKPTVVPTGGKFFPPLTVDTTISKSPQPLPVSSRAGSQTSSSPAGLSPRTSAIVQGSTLPVYQTATSTRVQQASQNVSQEMHTKPASGAPVPSSQQGPAPPQQVKTAWAPSPAQDGTPPRGSPKDGPNQMSSHTETSARVLFKGSTPPKPAPAASESLEGKSGKAMVGTSPKVAQSVGDRGSGDASASKIGQTVSVSGSSLSPNNNSSPVAVVSNSSGVTTQDSVKVSTSPEMIINKNDNVDISPPSVSSAISVLMSGAGTTTSVSTKPTYRYAPRSVIANTYMSKLGSGALDDYRKNMSQLYSNFPATNQDNKTGGTLQQDSSNSSLPNSPAKGDQGVLSPGSPASAKSPEQQGRSSPTPGLTYPQSGPLDQYSNGPPSYPQGSAFAKDAAERLRFRPNAPRPLRRRLSSGESSPDSQKAQTGPQQTAGTITLRTAADIIRVDNLADAYNNNFAESVTLFTTKVDNIPFADEASPKKYQSPTKAPDARSPHIPLPLRKKKTNLKSRDSVGKGRNRRVSFDPLALLLDASLEGELELVKQTAGQVVDPSQANDEGITALHNAICAGHFEIVKFLVEFGCNVNAPDSDGWTPLHCAASCNNLPMVKLLVEHGACIFATTISDHETAADKCEEDEDGYDGCSDYLYSIQEKLGIVNNGIVYAVFNYESQNSDELSFKNFDKLTILRKGDDKERDWWWARKGTKDGYVPRNLLGLYPRVPLKSQQDGKSKK